MLFKISQNIIRLLCVIMLLLIQYDVCTPLVDVLSEQWEIVENSTAENTENEASDEVYYRWGKSNLQKHKCLEVALLAVVEHLLVPNPVLSHDSPVPKMQGKAIQPHIIHCVYRI